jgi:hypothetical protein
MALIIAGAGTGKSALCEAVCSASLNRGVDNFQFLTSGSGLTFYIDTERSQQDHARSWLRTMRRADIKHGQTVENLRFELISCLPSIETRRQYLQSIVTTSGLTLLILDGLADFVCDVNDPEQSNEFLFWLLSEAKARYFGIMATLHPNPNDHDKKGRGHLGSEAMRRAESVLAIQKDGATGSRTISMDFAHGKNRNDGDTVSSSFSWNDDLCMFTSCEAPETKPAARQKQDVLIVALQARQPIYTYTELITAITEISGKTIPAAKALCTRLRSMGRFVVDGQKWGVIGHD